MEKDGLSAVSPLVKLFPCSWGRGVGGSNLVTAVMCVPPGVPPPDPHSFKFPYVLRYSF